MSGYPSYRATRPGSGWRLLGIAAVAAVVGLLVALVLLLGMSTTILGGSMQPTLDTGEQVVMNPLQGGAKASRFDLVVMTLGPQQVRAVKRLIGLPGDVVRIAVPTTGPPVVEVRPAGEAAFRRVVNPAWDRARERVAVGCCDSRGRQGVTRAAQVPEGKVFVLGDNLAESEDSRVFGFAAQADIGATVVWRIRPWSMAGPITNEVRLA